MTPRSDLKGKYAVVGVGQTSFGVLPHMDAYGLGLEALDGALDDAGLSASDIDGLIVNRIPDYQRFGELMGINPRYAAQLPAQGRMSGGSIMTAVAALEAGLCDCVALVYGNNGKSAGVQYGGEEGAGAVGEATWRRPYGMTSPGALHAIMFQRHMYEYGTTSEDLAHVAITFRDHAALNPNAVMRDPITVEDHQTSRFIAEPLHLFDYCLINDGGVALVITHADRARDLRQPPAYILGFSGASELDGISLPSPTYWREPCEAVARDVYAMAGISRDDLDGLQIYDNFSPVVLFGLEGFGFCEPGESGAWVREGHLALGGSLPTNTSGGHLSESYMQGWSLNVEAVRQIRGACGDRQIPDAQLIQYMCLSPVVSSLIYGREA